MPRNYLRWGGLHRIIVSRSLSEVGVSPIATFPIRPMYLFTNCKLFFCIARTLNYLLFFLISFVTYLYYLYLDNTKWDQKSIGKVNLRMPSNVVDQNNNPLPLHKTTIATHYLLQEPQLTFIISNKILLFYS